MVNGIRVGLALDVRIARTRVDLCRGRARARGIHLLLCGQQKRLRRTVSRGPAACREFEFISRQTDGRDFKCAEAHDVRRTPTKQKTSLKHWGVGAHQLMHASCNVSSPTGTIARRSSFDSKDVTYVSEREGQPRPGTEGSALRWRQKSALHAAIEDGTTFNASMPAGYSPCP